MRRRAESSPVYSRSRGQSVAGRFSVLLLVVFLAAGLAQAAQVVYQNAYDNGYRDGREAGKADLEAGSPFDFANHQAYQSADRGFEGEGQERDIYLVAYRRGFEDGYEAGYGLVQNSRSPLASSLPATVPARGSSTADSARNTAASLEVPAGTRIRIKLLDDLSSRRNEKGDRFLAEVKEDVLLGSSLAIPAGTRVEGVVTSVQRAGRIKGLARMDLEFRELQFPSGPELPIEGRVVSIEDGTDESVKEETGTIKGAGSKGEDLRTIGTSAGIGALIGILTGGKSGAKAGAAVGSIGGTVGVLASRGRDIDLRTETELVIRLVKKTTVPAEAFRPYP